MGGTRPGRCFGAGEKRGCICAQTVTLKATEGQRGIAGRGPAHCRRAQWPAFSLGQIFLAGRLCPGAVMSSGLDIHLLCWLVEEPDPDDPHCRYILACLSLVRVRRYRVR